MDQPKAKSQEVWIEVPLDAIDRQRFEENHKKTKQAVLRRHDALEPGHEGWQELANQQGMLVKFRRKVKVADLIPECGEIRSRGNEEK